MTAPASREKCECPQVARSYYSLFKDYLIRKRETLDDLLRNQVDIA
ncbi:MAG: hypothetical protein LBS03_10705 [Bacteroidales bacterium]|nr:hypothetical protein [Bacteroidales bacterium]